MELEKVLRERYSVRAFSKTPVSDEDLASVLEAARLAPTAVNNQPQRIYCVRTPEKLEALGACSPCIYGAQTVLVVCGDKNSAWTSADGARGSLDTDCAIAVTQMMLRCTDLGLGSCYVFRFDPEKTRQVLELPDHVVPHAFLPIGYPEMAPSARHSDRMPLSSFVKMV